MAQDVVMVIGLDIFKKGAGEIYVYLQLAMITGWEFWILEGDGQMLVNCQQMRSP